MCSRLAFWQVVHGSDDQAENTEDTFVVCVRYYRTCHERQARKKWFLRSSLSAWKFSNQHPVLERATLILILFWWFIFWVPTHLGIPATTHGKTVFLSYNERPEKFYWTAMSTGSTSLKDGDGLRFNFHYLQRSGEWKINYNWTWMSGYRVCVWVLRKKG